jgi:predicted thioesterase
MAEKRRIPRVHIQLEVTFGDGKRERTGTTANISKRGMSITSGTVVTPGLRVTGRLWLPSTDPKGRGVDFNAEVMWARKTRGARALAEQNMIGLRFVDAPGPDYDTFLTAEQVRQGSTRRLPRPPTPVPLEWQAEDVTPTTAFTPGLEGRTIAVVSPADLAAPPADVESSLSLPRAAAIMEDAVLQAITPNLPPGKTTLGAAWEQLSITHKPPTPAGTPLVVIATLMDAGSTGQRLRFEVVVKDGIRVVASGHHVRVVVKKTGKS